MTASWDNQARAALAAWGQAKEAPRLVKARENVVFSAELAGIGPVALRLHRPGYQTVQAIRSELVWTGLLAERGLPVPAPVLTLTGEPCAAVQGRVASCVRWIEGEPIGSAEAPLAGDTRSQRALMAAIGDLLATLHETSDTLELPKDFERPHWDRDGFLGPKPLWGPFWLNPAFDADERRLIADARAMAVSTLETMMSSGADYGLVHGDALRENILLRAGVGPGTLSLIDFDDSGFGFRLFDLATAVVQSLEEPALADIVAGLRDGYCSRRPLAKEFGPELAFFVMLRTFASAGWITTRAAPDDPRQRFYAGRAVRMARHVMNETAPWE